MFVKSIEGWLLRNHPSVPLYCVHLTQGNIDHLNLNPYRARVIILWKPDGPHRQQILGFFEYGKVEMLSDFPPLAGLPCRPNYHYRGTVQMDEIRHHLSLPNAIDPPIDWLLMLMGAKEPDHIPFSFLQWIQISIPYSVVEPTLLDLQNHYPKAEPEKWFRVPLEYVPNELAKNLILYSGAVVHVCSDDIWKVVRPNEPVKEFTDQMKTIMGMVVGRKRRRIELAEIDTLEEAQKQMAPCIRHIMDRPGFPSDTPRQYFVRVLRRGRVSLRIVEEILNQKNDSATPTQRRWDYKAHYEKAYAPPSCEKMNACSLCPMAPGKTLDVKKSECLLKFISDFPDKKPPHPKSFYGPVKWFEW